MESPLSSVQWACPSSAEWGIMKLLGPHTELSWGPRMWESSDIRQAQGEMKWLWQSPAGRALTRRPASPEFLKARVRPWQQDTERRVKPSLFQNKAGDMFSWIQKRACASALNHCRAMCTGSPESCPALARRSKLAALGSEQPSGWTWLGTNLGLLAEPPVSSQPITGPAWPAAGCCLPSWTLLFLAELSLHLR